MVNLMIVIGSVRPGRLALPIGSWVRETVERDERFTIDWADLAEIDLPLMNEVNHPRLGQYELEHTKEWAARVDAADAFVFVSPEYNYSYSPALKNAIDYLHAEWRGKPVGTVSYGGISGGTRGVVAMRPVELAVGLKPTGANVELAFAMKAIEDGRFVPRESQQETLEGMLSEIVTTVQVSRGLAAV